MTINTLMAATVLAVTSFVPAAFSKDDHCGGIEQMARIERLPLLHPEVQVHYAGSIDKLGGNADWDWWLYEDAQTKEWVLMDAQGPGCLWNFVAHHAVGHSDPVYRFYFDGSATPGFEIKHSEFGTKPPFIAPLADKFQPDKSKDARLQKMDFQIVRSFCPMPFAKSLKITSSVQLKGNSVESGGGGWGQAIWHSYPTSAGLHTFTGKENMETLLNLWRHPGEDPKPRLGNRPIVFEKSLPGHSTSCVVEQSGEGSFSAIRLRLDSMSGKAAYRQRPLTVECWAKLNSATGFNILVASDTKASAEHWELYSMSGSGTFSLYQPGRGGGVDSGANICDGKWHYLAAIIEPERVRLFVDGKLVKEAPASPLTGEALPGDLAFGQLVEGGIGCDGAVANIRISRGVREINGMPISPLTKDATTIGLWNFEKTTAAGLNSTAAPAVAATDGKDSLSAVFGKALRGGMTVNRSTLNNLWLKITWDGESKPAVECPVGAFFGNEFGLHHLQTLLQGVDKDGVMYSYWPMPFWKSAKVELENRGSSEVNITGSVDFKPASVLAYPRTSTGHFRTSAYQPMTPKQPGRDSSVATISGNGKVVAGLITAEKSMCEGDVRVHIDGSSSPAVQSDGSESWACYGWGFEFPPQANPASSYDGAGNSVWSELRLLTGDYYPFRTSFRMTVEGGSGDKSGTDLRSGLVFWYGEFVPAMVLTDSVDVGDSKSEFEHEYKAPASTAWDLTSAFEGEFDDIPITGRGRTLTGPSQFTVRIASDNQGILLRRRSDQAKRDQRAVVFVDEKRITERVWLSADGNPYFRWFEDEFLIPAAYTRGKKKISLRIEPMDSGAEMVWNESAYSVFSLKSVAH